MENQTNLKQTIINYGLILGIASIFLSLGIYASGMDLINQPTWVKVVSYIIFIAAIIMGIIKYKALNNNILSLGQAMKVGVGIALIGGIISAIYTFIFFSFIEPDMITQIATTAEEQMIEQNPEMSDDQIDAAMGITKMFMTPFMITTITIIGSLFMGTIIALIGGLILKKEDTSYNL